MATAKALECEAAWKEFRAVKFETTLAKAGVVIPSPSTRLSGFALDRKIRAESVLEWTEIESDRLGRSGGFNPLAAALRAAGVVKK